jgi:chemotaxis protein CheX
LILYHLTDPGEKAVADVRLLRKTCGFRDVPLLVLSDTAAMHAARGLISIGASDILPLPLTPETLRGKIDKLMRPVGEKIPVITKLINPFINATLDLMTTMAGLQVKRRDLFLKKNYRLFGDISGIMNFSGKIEGSVVVSFNEDLAQEIVGRILGLAPETITSDELKDGVGEIINIISGNAKANLSTTEFGHEISLPTVVTGPGHEIRHPRHAPCIVIIFEADNRPFAVQVSMTVNL